MQKTYLLRWFGLPARPAVLRTESKDQLEKMSAVFEDFLKPQNIIDQMQADDIVDLQWEKQYLRRCRNGILGTGTFRAVKGVFHKLGEYKLEESAAKQWFGTPEQKGHVEELLAHYGLDQSAIEGEAFNQSLKPLDQIGRMLGSLEHRAHRALRTLAESRAITAALSQDDQQDASREQPETKSSVTAPSGRDDAPPDEVGEAA